MKTPIEAKPVILLRFSQNLDTWNVAAYNQFDFQFQSG